MSPRRLIALLGAGLAVLVVAVPAEAIVGGTAVTDISVAPYQVALLINDPPLTSNRGDETCGGIIRDRTHVITAAHCVYDWLGSGQVASPGEIGVFAGSSTLSETTTAGRLAVRALSFQPTFDPISYDDDAAVLTLVDPLPDDAQHKAVPLVTSTAWAELQPLRPAPPFLVTGWGSTAADDGVDPPETPAFLPALQKATVSFVDDATCAMDYQPLTVDGPSQVCARGPGKDACFGDSGGPLVSGTPAVDAVLVGIVSNGIGCAQASFPGLYTEIDKPGVRSYVTQADPAPAPVNVAAPSIVGTATVGETLGCATGSWTESPSLAVQWVRSAGGGDTALTGLGGPATYAVQPADAGSTISCIVQATTNGGFAVARSAPTGIIPPSAGQRPAAPAPTAPVAQQDVNRPVTRIRAARCVKRTCTLTLAVTDAGFSAGVAQVTGSVRSTYRRRCTKNGRRTTCAAHRTRTFTAHGIAPTRFTIKLTKLPVGTQLFTLLATDKAGHKQLLPTRRTLRTQR